MKKQIYILIHGAWHGSWCWRQVTPLLEQAGDIVLTPDLPGHGSQQASFVGITLTTYVNEICSIISSLNVPVTLVGHSLGGVIISQVAEAIPERIAELIYVTPLLPTHQRSCVQEASHQQLNNVGVLLRANEHTNEMICDLSSPEKIRKAFYHCCSDQDFQLALSLLQVEPLRPMIDPVQLSNEKFGRVKKCFIECLQDRTVDIHNQRRMAKNAGITNIISLDCDHSPFFSMPAQLARAITKDLSE